MEHSIINNKPYLLTQDAHIYSHTVSYSHIQSTRDYGHYMHKIPKNKFCIILKLDVLYEPQGQRLNVEVCLVDKPEHRYSLAFFDTHFEEVFIQNEVTELLFND